MITVVQNMKEIFGPIFQSPMIYIPALVFILLVTWLQIKLRDKTINKIKNDAYKLNQKYDNDPKKYPCPSCRELTISSAQKRQLENSKSINCPKCNQPITIPYWQTRLMMIPAYFIFVIIGFMLFGLSYLLILLMIPGAYLAMYLKMNYVPLIKKVG